MQMNVYSEWEKKLNKLYMLKVDKYHKHHKEKLLLIN